MPFSLPYPLPLPSPPPPPSPLSPLPLSHFPIPSPPTPHNCRVQDTPPSPLPAALVQHIPPRAIYFFQSSGLYEGGARGTTLFLHSRSIFLDCPPVHVLRDLPLPPHPSASLQSAQGSSTSHKSVVRGPAQSQVTRHRGPTSWTASGPRSGRARAPSSSGMRAIWGTGGSTSQVSSQKSQVRSHQSQGRQGDGGSASPVTSHKSQASQATRQAGEGQGGLPRFRMRPTNQKALYSSLVAWCAHAAGRALPRDRTLPAQCHSWAFIAPKPDQLLLLLAPRTHRPLLPAGTARAEQLCCIRARPVLAAP